MTADQLLKDTSGYSLFAGGDLGATHVMAHRMLDADRPDLGYRLLGAWLDGRSGAGSEWVHIEWHMAVFELAMGKWNAAFARFQNEILPAATTTGLALTDAPSMLWRLSLASSGPADLPWEPVRATALTRIGRWDKPYVELHHLLALAGAGDIESLDRWLSRRAPTARERSEYLVARMAEALRAYAAGHHQLAASTMAIVVPHLSKVGGSRAQNQLFNQIERTSRRQTSGRVWLPSHEIAA